MVDGEYRQLSTSTLQIENEYYSSIRPKRVANSGERPTAALRRGGIEYVEIRSVDINMFDPVGINQNAMRFVEVFLIYCLLSESPLLDDESLAATGRNQKDTAKMGRDPKLELVMDDRRIELRDWAHEIIVGVRQVAELIDRGQDHADYVNAVDTQAELVRNSAATPSARILQELKENGSGFYEFAYAMAKGHKNYFSQLEALPAERLSLLEQEVLESIQRQKDIETSDTMTFDEYLASYFASG